MTNIINKVIKNGTEYQIYASGGAAITVDSELSTTSTNPAQNKVITTAINGKAADDAVVKLTGNQTVAGTKTFSTSPKVPSKNSSASSSNKTVIATEAQVALKQDALTLPSSPTNGHLVTWGSNNKTLTDGGAIPTVNDTTITFTQGGVSKGTITTNQSSASTIALDVGGSYDNITKSEIQTGTATTQRTVSASVIKSALPRISSLPNNILTSGEIWAGNLSDYKAMGSGRPSTTLFFCIDDGWKPGANTIAYFPLKENQNDVLNNYTLPLTGTQEQIGFTFNKSGDQNITINSSQRFVSCWVKFNSYLSSGAQILAACAGGPFYNYYNSYSDANKRFQAYSGSSKVFNSDQIQTNANTWYHYAVGWDGTKVVCYLNGSKVAEGTCNVSVGTSCKFITNINVTFSELIYESAVRTDQEIADYYNQTKSNYGL